VADQGIKKAIVPKPTLPGLHGDGQDYLIRYRIVSEDKNRSSHWSPIYSLVVDNVDPIPYALDVITNSIDSSKKSLQVIWTPRIDQTSFDIYKKINNQSWEYVLTVGTNTWSTILDVSTTSIAIAVQIPTFPKQRYPGTTLFESNQIDLVV
jgi:hypothetical protein